MSEIKWTKAQENAIEVRAPKVLVSAAAGSGKSTVLTERVIRSLIREENPNDLSKIIAVTFTRSAASELKTKIGNALRKASAVSPQNKRLSDQLLKLPSAKISTIDSMCASIIKTHFQNLGIAAGMRVAEETELRTLRLSVMSDLIEEAYSGMIDGIPDFNAFVLNFVSERDSSLADTFLGLYDSLRNQPDYEKCWEQSLSEFDFEKDFRDTVFSKILCNVTLIKFGRYKIAYENTISGLDDSEAFKKSYLPAFLSDLEFIEKVIGTAKSGDFHALSEVLGSYSPESLGRITSKDSTNKTKASQELRNTFKKITKELFEKFAFSGDDIKMTSERTRFVSGQMLIFIRAFHKNFSFAKQKRSLMDFADIEELTLSLLYTDIQNKVISDTAKNISSHLDEIYVDEYQDISPVQDMIFTALSVNCPIFMVGDIKQSIYNFRGASPDIFSGYRRSFAPFTEGKFIYDTNVTVFLSDNFRSDRSVTEFANTVADGIFGCTPENDPLYSYRIPYNRSDRLIPRKETDETADPGVSLLICEPVPDYTYESEGDTSHADFLEAEMVANKIYRLIKNGVSAENISILLRSVKKSSSVFENALRRRGIPVFSERGTDMFSSPEIRLAVCILNCIDNPYQDIFLAGAMRSPVFGFTLDDLITIRRAAPGIGLYDALCNFAESTSDTKSLYFLDFVSRMREYGARNSVDRLIWQIYSETSFFSIIYEGGDVIPSTAALRRANLLKFHSMAKEFVSSGRVGLYPFMERIRLMIDNPDKTSGVCLPGEGVQILSMHKSKGLEFEHCFVCALSSSVKKKDDISKELVLSRSLGVMMKLRDSLGITKTDSPARLAVAMQNDILKYDEELRILYVALTRAKTHLYVSGKTADFEKLSLTCKNNASFLHPDTFSSLDGYLSWILTAINAKTDLAPTFLTEVKNSEDVYSDTEKIINEKLPSETTVTKVPYTKELYDALNEKLSFVYPYSESASLPSKLSVSKLYPEILDEEVYDINEILSEPEDEETDIPDNSSNLRTPDFIIGDKTFTGADRGTATHIFMQFCSFENTEKYGVDAEIERLTEKRFILPSHASIIDRNAVSVFFKSDIYSEMKASGSVSREYRFNIKFPASDFTKNSDLASSLENEFIFVQGVIDCYFLKKDGTVCLLDYKTDKVPYNIIGDINKEDAFFIERHGNQLKYYKIALEKLTGKKVTSVLIYSFFLGRCINITI